MAKSPIATSKTSSTTATRSYGTSAHLPGTPTTPVTSSASSRIATSSSRLWRPTTYLENSVPDDARPISMQKASAARLYDHYLGGSHNYPVDRLFAAQVTALCPFMPDLALHNRQFLRRAVAQLAAAGIRQFIDIGSGIPTSP